MLSHTRQFVWMSVTQCYFWLRSQVVHRVQVELCRSDSFWWFTTNSVVACWFQTRVVCQPCFQPAWTPNRCRCGGDCTAWSWQTLQWSSKVRRWAHRGSCTEWVRNSVHSKAVMLIRFHGAGWYSWDGTELQTHISWGWWKLLGCEQRAG